jgi:hypothetical protein
MPNIGDSQVTSAYFEKAIVNVYQRISKHLDH